MADALALPFPDASFDALTVAFGLRNMADWGVALTEMARVLAAGRSSFGSRFFASARPVTADLSLLPAPLFALAGRACLTGESSYNYLGVSIEKFPSGSENMCALMEASWFQRCNRSNRFPAAS